MTSPSDLIAERRKTHGAFTTNAKISQGLKDFLRKEMSEAGVLLTDVQQEALDMICLKISRICSGQAGFHDHWADIAGYAKLAEQDGMDVSPSEKTIPPGGLTYIDNSKTDALDAQMGF
jgi:hypothetical protein